MMKFEVGDIVEAIEVDWFHPELMPIGSKWIVHGFHAGPGRELLTLFPHPDHPLASEIIKRHRTGLSPWAKKFRHWEPGTNMADYADVYDEIMRAQELIQASSGRKPCSAFGRLLHDFLPRRIS